MTWERVCRVEDIPEGRGWPVWPGGLPLAAFRTPGGVRVVDNVCCHRGAPLDDGWVEDGCLTCPWHGWRYDLETGEHLTVLGRRPGLAIHPSKVVDGEVWVDLPAQGAAGPI